MLVAPVQHRPATPEHAIHRARESRTDALHPAAERVFAMGLHDQVDVLLLEEVVHDTKPALRPRLCERASPFLQQPGVA